MMSQKNLMARVDDLISYAKDISWDMLLDKIVWQDNVRKIKEKYVFAKNSLRSNVTGEIIP